MRLVIALAGLAALAACQTPCAETPTRREAVYACSDGSHLEVTFDFAAGRALVSEDGGTALDLPIQISGSGFRYAEEGVALRGRGDEASWTSPAGETVSCRIVSQTTLNRATPVASETPRASSMRCEG